MNINPDSKHLNAYLNELRRIFIQISYREVVLNDFNNSASYSKHLRDLNDQMRMELHDIIINNEINRSVVYLREVVKLIENIEIGLSDFTKSLQLATDISNSESIILDGGLRYKLNQYAELYMIPTNSITIHKEAISEVQTYLNLKLNYAIRGKNAILDLTQGLENSLKTQKDKEYLTTKQQVLVIFFLKKNHLFDYYKIHQDETKRSKVIAALLNRDDSNIKKYLHEIFNLTPDRDEKYFSQANLSKVLDVFEKAGMPEIANEVSSIMLSKKF